MKYLTLLLLLISLLLPVSTVEAAGSNPYCVGMTGKFTATNWPGGSIMVACAGDTGGAGCRGEIATIKPGESFDFDNCTCPPYASESIFGKSGCLVIGESLKITQLSNGNRPVQGSTSLPAGCKLNKPQPIACGVNGDVINAPFSITCTAPSPTPTPSHTPTPIPSRTPTPTRTPTPSPTPSPTPTPTSTPTPTPSSCPVPSVVPNVRITCPNCAAATPTPTPGITADTPTPTIVSTITP